MRTRTSNPRFRRLVHFLNAFPMLAKTPVFQGFSFLPPIDNASRTRGVRELVGGLMGGTDAKRKVVHRHARLNSSLCRTLRLTWRRPENFTSSWTRTAAHVQPIVICRSHSRFLDARERMSQGPNQGRCIQSPPWAIAAASIGHQVRSTDSQCQWQLSGQSKYFASRQS